MSYPVTIVPAFGQSFSRQVHECLPPLSVPSFKPPIAEVDVLSVGYYTHPNLVLCVGFFAVGSSRADTKPRVLAATTLYLDAFLFLLCHSILRRTNSTI